MLEPGRVVSIDRLIEAAWGEAPPRTAATALQGHVFRLRQLLEPESDGQYERIVTHPSGYLLDAEPDEVDVSRFEAYASAGRSALGSGDTARAARALGEALGEWRGPALADFLYEPFAAAEAERLEERRLAVMEDLHDAKLALGLQGQLVPELELLITQHRLRERLHGQLMRALYASGRQADALEAYRRARDVLDELGIEPSEELQDLERQILRHAPGLAQNAPPERESAGFVPAAPTRLVGRTSDVLDACELLGRPDVRLLTFTGTGGTGKTRLALEVAKTLTTTVTDGVFVVELAGLTDAQFVPASVAQGLTAAGLPAEVADDGGIAALEERASVLVLDNLEQILPQAGAWVSALLARASRLTVLATSRRPLAIAGERAYAVSPLDVPPPAATDAEIARAEAVTLFVERARAADRTFALTPENAQSVAEVCRRLDGLPLALELAAARVRHLSPAAILQRLGARFDVLVGGPVDAPDRQRTLRAAIEWSYELLDLEQKRVFSALSALPAGCRLGRIDSVCATDGAAELALSLVDHALVISRDDPDGEPRLAMLETIRAFAGERLEDELEGEAVRTRALASLLALLEEASPELSGPAQGRWLTMLDREHDNARELLGWALECRPCDALLLAAALQRYWYLRGHASEGLSWLQRALEPAATDPTPARASALMAAGTLAGELGDFRSARAHTEESATVYRSIGDGLRLSAALNNVGALALHQGEIDTALEAWDESMELKRSLGDRLGGALTLANLAVLRSMQGDYAAAEAEQREALTILRELGNTIAISNSVSHLGELALLRGDVEAARSALEEGLALREEIGKRNAVAESLLLLGRTALLEGADGEARRQIADGTAIYLEAGARDGVATALEALAELEVVGDPASTVRLCSAAAGLREVIGAAPTLAEREHVAGLLAAARKTLGEDTFDTAWTAGSQVDPLEAAAAAAAVSQP